MGFNPLKVVRGIFGGGPLVKAEGVADQIQDKQAERRVALALLVFCSGLAFILVCWGISKLICRCP